MAACASRTPGPAPVSTTASSASATYSPSPSVTVSPTLTTIPTSGEIWENFPPPRETPPTPIPPPLTGLAIPEEVRVLAVAGVDRPYPYNGRTDALALVIYHPRLARASLVSIPPDLLSYIPGVNMQRMYTAYSIGGPRLLNSAIEYNFGLRPNNYAIFNLDSFGQLIDDLGGINVTVLENVQPYCPGLLPGLAQMNGERALCYMRLRVGENEGDRNRRQQEVFRTIFLRLVESGNLVRVPELYGTYRSSIDSDLTLDQITASLPLALKLGDPNRIGYFQMGEKELKVWEISSEPKADVFLPVRPALMAFLQQAVDFVTTPSPLSEVVVTLQYELTTSPTPTSTYTVTPTSTSTRTPTKTLTPRPSRTPTKTLTPTRTPSRTPTRKPGSH